MKIDREKLRKSREEKGYSLRELAELSGVDYTSLHRWETLDTAQPFPKNVKKVATALGIEISELVVEHKRSSENGNNIKILNLNMNMFKYQFDDSFDQYLKEIDPDVAILQECRIGKLVNNIIRDDNGLKYLIYDYKGNNDYYVVVANRKEIKNNISFTTAVVKKDKFHKDGTQKNDTNDDYINKRVEVSVSEMIINGIHITSDSEDSPIAKLLNYDADIICGDFNANTRKNNSNCKILEQLKKRNYINLWESGIKQSIAYYKNYNGEEKRAEQGIHYRTYSANTHIDYCFGKEVKLKKITMDFRTLAFTDHCGFIIEIESCCP